MLLALAFPAFLIVPLALGFPAFLSLPHALEFPALPGFPLALEFPDESLPFSFALATKQRVQNLA